MDMQYECDNVFPNLKCVPEFFPRKKHTCKRQKQCVGPTEGAKCENRDIMIEGVGGK